MQIAQKGVGEERKRLSMEYEQRIRQLNKDLEDNKHDLVSAKEHALNERRKIEEFNARLVAELNGQIQDLQFKLSQLSADQKPSTANEIKQVTDFIVILIQFLQNYT